MSMFCNNDRVCWVVFHFIKLLHSKHLSSFLQNFSIVFAVANNTPYRSPLPGASITILALSPLRLVSFYSVFFLFIYFFFFNFYYHVQLQQIAIFQALFIPGFIFLLSMREKKFVSTLNSVKNVAIQILGRGPN